MNINNKRIAQNTLMLYFRMILTMGVSLYTSRVVLEVLGVEDFGIYSVVGSVVVMFGFLNYAMSTATQRFFSFELGRKNIDQLKKVFSLSVSIHAIIAIFIFLLAETIGLWFLNARLAIPLERMETANWVYQFSVFTFMVNVMAVPYNAAIISHERMNIYAYVSILEVILRLAIVFLLQCFEFDKLQLYAIFVFIVSLIIRVVYQIYCKRKFEECTYRFVWDKDLFIKMTSFSGWSLFGQLSRMGVNQGIDFALNIYFGVIINAATGVANQVLNAVRNLVNNFQTAFNPQITQSYAAKNQLYLNNLVNTSAKFSFLLLYIFSIPVILNADFILSIWLVQVPQYAAEFCKIMIIYTLIESLTTPLWILVHATGNIGKYQVVISSIYSLELLVSLLFLYWGYGPQIVYLVRIFINCFSLLARLLYANKLADLPIKPYLVQVLGRLFIVVLLSLPLPLYIASCSNTLFSFLVSSAIFVILTLSFSYFWGLSQKERAVVSGYVGTIFNKLRK